jgi:hypothetical protein
MYPACQPEIETERVETYPIVQVNMKAKETCSELPAFQLAIICGISATPQENMLASPNPNETRSLVSHMQSWKYLNTQALHPSSNGQVASKPIVVPLSLQLVNGRVLQSATDNGSYDNLHSFLSSQCLDTDFQPPSI